jgi:thymidine kinase
MTGYLHITFGPMFSGKTTSLIDTANRFITVRKMQNVNVKLLVINHSSDTRPEKTIDSLTPHTEKKIVSCDKKSIYSSNLSDIDVVPYDYIVVDECQFFQDLNINVKKWLNIGKHIHCSGLIADSDKNIFGELHTLIHCADHVEQLKALCTICGDKHLNAPFTKCIIDKKDQTLVGSCEYIPVCGTHF